jgi:hypothetical protein
VVVVVVVVVVELGPSPLNHRLIAIFEFSVWCCNCLIFCVWMSDRTIRTRFRRACLSNLSCSIFFRISSFARFSSSFS